VIALVALWTNTMGLIPGSKISDKRSLATIEAAARIKPELSFSTLFGA
jgi:hypothetical protein